MSNACEKPFCRSAFQWAAARSSSISLRREMTMFMRDSSILMIFASISLPKMKPMPMPATEINLIQTFADTKAIGLTINHENMTEAEVTAAITRYECELGIPTTDALARSPACLVEMVLSAFPELAENLTAGVR